MLSALPSRGSPVADVVATTATAYKEAVGARLDSKVMVCEALLGMGLKGVPKPTVRDCIRSEYAEIASGKVPEDKIHPTLLACVKKLLQ